MGYQVHVYASTAGIALFLADYGRAFSDHGAIVLAQKALEWVESNENGAVWSEVEQNPFGLGLATERLGVALAWLRLSQSSANQQALEKAVDHATPLLTSDPPTKSGLLIGTAGCGILLLRLWEETGDDRYLERAREWAAHILASQWDRHDRLGMGIGFAGIGHFWLAFHEVTKKEAWIDLLHRTAAKLIEHAEPDRGHLNWRRILEEPEITRC